MRVLTISDGDEDGTDETEPLLVARVDGPMIRRVLALVADQLAAPPTDTARPSPRHGVRPLRATPDRDDP